MDRLTSNPFVHGLLLAGVLAGGGCSRMPAAAHAEVRLASATSAEPALFEPVAAMPIRPPVVDTSREEFGLPEPIALPVAATAPVPQAKAARPPAADPVRFGLSADPPSTGLPLLRRMPATEEPAPAPPKSVPLPKPLPAAEHPPLAWPNSDAPSPKQPAPSAPAPIAQQLQPAPQQPPQPRRELLPAPLAPQEVAALRSVDLQLQQKLVRAQELAGRGAAWSSRGELLDVLRMVAEASDSLRQSDEFRRALNSGLEALREVEDFSPRSGHGGREMSVEAIVAAHRTPILKNVPCENLTPLAAQQEYLSFAQRQLGAAAAGTVSGSAALYGLGRLQDSLAAAPGTTARSPASGPRAMALYQAALLADRTNHLAANELGVLLAKFGENAAAKQLLIHSLQTEQQAVTWHNLAVVHDRMGERDLAQRARLAGQQLASRRGVPPGAGDRVRWVDAATFASASEEAGWPEQTTPAPVAKAPPAKTADAKTASSTNDTGWSFPFWTARGNGNAVK